MIAEEDSNPIAGLHKMKVAELRKLLKDRGLPCLGSKPALLARLQKALSPGAAASEEAEAIEEGAEEEDVEEDASDAENVIAEQGIKAQEEVVPEKTDAVLKKTAPPENTENSQEPKEKEDLTNVDSQPVPATEKVTPVVTPPTSETPSIQSTDKSNVVSAKPTLTSDEKLRQRAERFGITSDNDKKAARAARFGTVTTNLSNKPSAKIVSTPVTAEDIDRLKKRAQRFGTVVSSTLSKLEDEDKLRKRKQRFGQITGPTSNPTSTTTTTTTTTTTANKSIEEIEEKKRKRAERFGLS